MKICVGLSGGVDSSVAALLLKQQGYDVFAMFMQNWHDTEGTLHGDCEWEEDRLVAEMVAKKIGIPFHFVDLSDEYRKRVVDYMFSEYEQGRTPNPDVLCNREIKFDAFLDAALKLGADMVATGHYCRNDQVDGPDKSSGPVERGISTLGSIDSALGELGAEITEGRNTVSLTYTDAYLTAKIKDGKIIGGTWHYLVKIFVGNAKGKLGISITLKNLKAAVDYKVVI